MSENEVIDGEKRKDSTSPSSEYKTVLDFGVAIAGSTITKLFKIKNDANKIVCYTVKRDPEVNPIYQVFDFDVYDAVVTSGKYLQIKVIFKPNTPRFKYIDHFQIASDNCDFFRIFLKGESIGPHVMASVRTIQFFVTPKETIKKHIFEIKNTSQAPAKYQFDISQDHTPFRVDKIFGTLEPKKHGYVTICFEPKESRDYSGVLTCLVLNQEPVIITLYGVYDMQYNYHSTEIGFVRYQDDLLVNTGFFGYMSDCIKIRETVPSVSLSHTDLDFGRVPVTGSSTLPTCLTSHMNLPIKVIWDNQDDIFKIKPREVDIPPSESVLFEVTFTPNIQDSFFKKILTCQIYWTDPRKTCDLETKFRTISVPLVISLRLLGDSFPENERWIPMVHICPQIVTLPPTIPNYPTYGNFLLKSTGFLPVSFKFIHPGKTNFTLKPMIGVLEDYQVITVHLQPDAEENKAYVEYWEVLLNGRKENCSPFYIKCFSAQPAIIIGIENHVSFKCVHYGAQETENVIIKNISTHYIQYSFQLLDFPYLTIDHPSGEIASNETIVLKWHIIGGMDVPNEFNVRCELHCTRNMDIVIGRECYTRVTVHTQSIYAKLCSTPSEEHLGEVKWGSNHTIKFYIFNFCEAAVHYKMLAVEDGYVLDDSEISISPEISSVNAKGKALVIIQISACLLGHHNITIQYIYRKCATSCEIIPGDAEDVFKLTYTTIYPVVQILDINFHNYGPNFSKVSLWKSLDVEAINTILRSLKCGESKVVQSILPDYEENESEYEIILLVSNTTKFPTEFTLKRIKICDCRTVMGSLGISLRKVFYECKHREMLKLSFSESVLEGLCTEKLKFQIRYTEPSSNELVYKLHLSDNRCLEWHFYMKIVPIGTTIPSIYTQDYMMNLRSANLAMKNPPVQAFSFYNDANSEVVYSLNTSGYKEVNEDYGLTILECINPTNSIKPFDNCPLLFKFNPLKLETIGVELPLMIGSKPVDFIITGAGSMPTQWNFEDMSTRIPSLPYSTNIESSIILSIDEIVVNGMSVWSSSEKLIFIKNLTKNRTFGYSWNRRDVPGILAIKTHRRKGVLLPRETHPVLINIESFDVPCSLRLNLVCQLLDHTQHSIHIKSLEDYATKEAELEGQFTITEAGISYPVNDVLIEPDAQLKYISLDICVNVVTVADRDVCLDIATQFAQTPQFILHANIPRVMESYGKATTGSDYTIRSFAIDKMKLEGDKSTPTSFQLDFIQDERKQKKQTNMDMYKFVVECLLADVLKSELFYSITMKKSDLPSGFYPQYKYFESDFQKLVKQYPEEENLSRTKRTHRCRTEYLKNFMERSQPPICAKIFGKAITEAIRPAFQLGFELPSVNQEDLLLPDYILKYICNCEEPIFGE